MIEEIYNPLHGAVLQLVQTLMDLNPETGTPEFELLRDLAHAVELYEQEKYPELATPAPAEKHTI